MESNNRQELIDLAGLRLSGEKKNTLLENLELFENLSAAMSRDGKLPSNELQKLDAMICQLLNGSLDPSILRQQASVLGQIILEQKSKNDQINYGITEESLQALQNSLSMRLIDNIKALQNYMNDSAENKEDLLRIMQIRTSMNSVINYLEPLQKAGLAQSIIKPLLSEKSSIDEKLQNFIDSTINGKNAKDKHDLSELTGVDLTNEEVVAVMLLSYDDNRPFTKQEKKFLQKFLLDNNGNMDLNKKLKKLCEVDTVKFGIKSQATAFLIKYTFKTRCFNQAGYIVKKFTENNNVISQGKTPENKLSLAEFSVVHDIASLKSDLDQLDQRGLISSDPDLMIFHEICVQKASALINQLQEGVKQSSQLSAGSLVFDNIQKKADIMGAQLGYIDKLTTLSVTKYGHTSIISQANDSGHKIVHINPQYKEEDFSLKNFLYSDAFTIKLDKLISIDNQQSLQEKLGDNWQQQINQQYQKIQREIYDKGLLRKIGAASNRDQVTVGIMTTLGLGSIIQSGKNDPDSVREQLFEQKYDTDKPEMICSEMSARIIVASITELNNQLSKEYGLPKDTLQVPIRERVNLNSLHPEALLQELQRFDCVEAVPKAEVVTQHIQIKP